jgi:hypothetical protein
MRVDYRRLRWIRALVPFARDFRSQENVDNRTRRKALWRYRNHAKGEARHRWHLSDPDRPGRTQRYRRASAIRQGKYSRADPTKREELCPRRASITSTSRSQTSSDR